MVPSPWFPTTTSGLPSPLKSATASATGRRPARYSGGATNLWPAERRAVEMLRRKSNASLADRDIGKDMGDSPVGECVIGRAACGASSSLAARLRMPDRASANIVFVLLPRSQDAQNCIAEGLAFLSRFQRIGRRFDS